MNDQSEISGPEFLDKLADRQEAGGFTIEADLLRTRSREWSRDKQAIENGTPPPAPKADSKAFSATLIESDAERNRLVLRPDGKGPRSTSGRYHLIPIEA